MHRVWTKIVVAGLIILGEGAFASESNQHSDDSYEASGNAVRLSQPVVLDDAVSRWIPSLAGAHTIQPCINPTYQVFVAVTVPVPNPPKYHPFNPSAPPVPAS
jgi:hypothetical protein